LRKDDSEFPVEIGIIFFQGPWGFRCPVCPVATKEPVGRMGPDWH